VEKGRFEVAPPCVHDAIVISLGSVGWKVLLDQDVDRWFLTLTHEDPRTAALIQDAIDILAREGPSLGRPLVDRIRNSQHHNMKELRPGSAGSSEIRILFAFDPQRRAILLVAGDKAGDWSDWYKSNVPIADARLNRHLGK